MQNFDPLIAELINELSRLPGVGRKSAQRLGFHLLRQPVESVRQLADTLVRAREGVHFCSQCFNLTSTDPCEICSSDKRDRSQICVVESPQDVAAMERIHEYKGLYHVLHGSINPMQGIGPDQIKLMELFRRLQENDEITEVILATNPTVEGEATALYIAKLLKSTGIRCSRIAHGLPMGADLEYADEVTLAKALSGRREL